MRLLITLLLLSGINFDGSNDILDTADDSTSTVKGVHSFGDNENWSISVWYKGTDSSTTDQGASLAGRDNGDIFACFAIRNAKLQYIHHNSSWQHNLASTTSVNDNKWHFLAYVNRSDETGEIFVDGTSEASGSSSIGPANTYFTVNHWMRGFNGRYTSGTLGIPSIHNRALNVAESSALRFGANQLPGNGRWMLFESSGSNLTHLSVEGASAVTGQGGANGVAEGPPTTWFSFGGN